MQARNCRVTLRSLSFRPHPPHSCLSSKSCDWEYLWTSSPLLHLCHLRLKAEPDYLSPGWCGHLLSSSSGLWFPFFPARLQPDHQKALKYTSILSSSCLKKSLSFVVLQRDQNYTHGEIWKYVETFWVAVGPGGRYWLLDGGDRDAEHSAVPGGIVSRRKWPLMPVVPLRGALAASHWRD